MHSFFLLLGRLPGVWPPAVSTQPPYEEDFLLVLQRTLGRGWKTVGNFFGLVFFKSIGFVEEEKNINLTSLQMKVNIALKPLHFNMICPNYKIIWENFKNHFPPSLAASLQRPVSSRSPTDDALVAEGTLL